MENTTIDFIQCTILVQWIINDEQYTIVVGCFSVVWMVVSSLGIVGNFVNVRTFIAMKLEDGVTVSFLVLSVSDLLYNVAMFLRASSSLFDTIEMAFKYAVWFIVQPYAMHLFFVSCGIALYIMTVLTTTFLAVARCMCVVKPLHFKNTFTKSRCIVILVSFAVFTIISYLPVFFNMGLVNQFDPRINASRPILWISHSREFVKDAVWSARDTFLPAITQVIVIVCVIVMAKSLHESSKFREASRSVSTTGNSHHERRKDSTTPTRKDIQVVRQVGLISFVYIVCNMPKIIFNILGIIEPDFTLDRQLQNVYLLTLSLAEIFQMFNSSVNVFIYYKYNSKFRRCCQIYIK